MMRPAPRRWSWRRRRFICLGEQVALLLHQRYSRAPALDSIGHLGGHELHQTASPRSMLGVVQIYSRGVRAQQDKQTPGIARVMPDVVV
jgi:hypothetical protein